MPETRQTVRLFFSWQSDLPQAPTTRAIRAALRAASTLIEAEYQANINIEEATSNSSGSPYIPFELAEKIRNADIFVGDITPVVRLGAEDSIKNIPNPNVTFELGMATAHLGWQRVIMMFNEGFSQLKNLPFDFDRHRISKFHMKVGQERTGAAALTALMKDAISRIFLDNPKRPRELEGKPPEILKKNRDIENIHWFMRQINTSYLDQHMLEMPYYLNWSTIFVYEGIDAVVRSTDFRFYDKDLDDAAHRVHKYLRDSLAHIEKYHETPNTYRQVYRRQHNDQAAIKDEKKAFRDTKKSVIGLRKALNDLIEIIREKYLEINIDETNRLCAAAYIRNTQFGNEDV